MVEYICNPSTWGAEGTRVHGQPGLYRKTLFQTKQPKKKNPQKPDSQNKSKHGSATRKLLCNYLKQQKCHSFLLLFYTKLEKKREEQVLRGRRVPVEGEEEGKGKGVPQILSDYVCKWKQETC
jgi:hypothetical protein